jgi:hypothetical protein
MVYSDDEYAALLEGQTMKDLKNMVTTIVKNVRFTLTGKRKGDIIDHLVKHTQFDDVTGVTLRGDITKVPEADLLRETSVTASGMKRKTRDDAGSIKPTSAKAMKMKAPMLAEIKAQTERAKLIKGKAMMNAITERLSGNKFNQAVLSERIPTVKKPGKAARQPRSDKGVPRGPRKVKEI